MSLYPNLLSPTSLGAVELSNRVVMAPMTRSRALPNGTVPDLYQTYFEQRASAGLLMTDATMVSPQAVGYLGTPGIWTEVQVESWRAVVDAVHAVDGRIAMQIMHCGRISLNLLQPENGPPVSSSAMRAPTTMLFTPTYEQVPADEPRALELSEIPGVVTQFASAARNAKSAGFDAIEIHAANGYLIDQFLRDGVNQRHDKYGGSVENRARLLLEITEAVAKEFGADRTGVRLSPTNPFNDMADRDPLGTFSTVLRHLARIELAWLHLASLNDADFSRRLRDAYGKPLLLNGGFTAAQADDAIRSELAVAVSFGAAYIANPDLVERFATNAELATPDSATMYGGGAKGYIDYPTLDAA